MLALLLIALTITAFSAGWRWYALIPPAVALALGLIAVETVEIMDAWFLDMFFSGIASFVLFAMTINPLEKKK